MNPLLLRDTLWSYPDVLFFGKNSIANRIISFIVATRPFSYFTLTITIAITIVYIFYSNYFTILRYNDRTLIEGVIVGSLPSGNPIGPTKLNPLLISSPQIDKDIIELVYQPLIKVYFNKESKDSLIVPMLAESFNEIKQGDDVSFRFNLRQGVKWHDGSDFTAKDVEATFSLIKELSQNGAALNQGIAGATIAANLSLQVIDDHKVDFKITEGNVPNFYELISFKIFPTGLVDQFRESIINAQYRKESFSITTVGTGPFRLVNIGVKDIRLEANPDYYLGEPKIKEIVLKLLVNEEEAVESLRSGVIHSLSNLDTQIINKVKDQANLNVLTSDIIFSQYWGLYFNLSETSKDYLKDKDVRLALALAINKEVARESALKNSATAHNTIPEVSGYFDPGFKQRSYNLKESGDLLTKKGWAVVEEIDKDTGAKKRIRKKGDQLLTVNLKFVDNVDREILVNSIKTDLENIGVTVNVSKESVEQIRKSRIEFDFDLILYGVNTFIDPDRYEFFHSSQIVGEDGSSGLNIAGFSSSEIESRIDPKKRDVVRGPLMDFLLSDGRSEKDTKERKEIYSQVQRILQDETPVIFLYHPTISYVVNKRVKNIDLQKVLTNQDRFFNVHQWQIEYSEI